MSPAVLCDRSRHNTDSVGAINSTLEVDLNIFGEPHLVV